MIGAKKARLLSESFKNINDAITPGKLYRYTNLHASTLALKMICASIYSSIRDGFESCICYYDLSDIDRRILRSHGYTIEVEQDDDTQFNVISWENAN